MDKFPSVLRRCGNGHTMLCLVAPWWFSILKDKCPECGMPYTEMKWYGMCTLDEMPDERKVKNDDKEEERIWNKMDAGENWPAV